MPWSRTSTVKKDRTGADHPGGYKLKADPTLSATSQAVLDGKGKRVGVIKKVGGKFAHSRDNYAQKFGSAQAALRQFAVRVQASDPKS